MASLTGKVAIVTGGSGGLGSAIVQQIAARGAKVVVHYARGVENAQKVVSAVESEGGEALALQADLAQVEDIRRDI
ncbi:putative dehydrogenase/reductase [Calothrix sp. NIES-4071]|nr:putative dehydrogenase/reductase [Calothrix sp. NIES-4071]BAZ57954.1 putative dehydrogenase/reductase [Calothrix sp. NIES-4105]